MPGVNVPLFLRRLATRANRRAITVILEIILVFVVFSARRAQNKHTKQLLCAKSGPKGTGPCFIRIRSGCGPPNINRQLSEMKQSVAQSAIRAPRNDRQGKH
ncbi:hypothetical protein MTP99_012000 [Tenebrio molitor]|jgi:hypothetical protein|nr:hypothetical protein MTP99_012000 [Tenebrio molitor]